MTGLTNFITHAKWSDIATIWFVLIDDAYTALEHHFGQWRRRGPKPSFTDSEVITVSLLIDTFFDGNEEKGLRMLRQFSADLFPNLLPNGQFNYRRRLLGPIMEQLRRYLSLNWGLIEPTDELRIIDSAPVPVCTYKRANRNTNFVGTQYFGKMYSQAGLLCGFRLHLTVSDQQQIDNWLLAPAAHHDTQLLWSLSEEQLGLWMLGDGAYKSPIEHAKLRDKRAHRVFAPPRRDSKMQWPKPFNKLFKRLRKRVESVLSVLSTVFKVKTPGSRSSDGLVARTATRILAYSLCFITNAILAGAR
jgi:hypothetical protein